jgi:hypothetical protein
MITFPKDFEERQHPLYNLGYNDAKQWIYVKPNGGTISIVGGAIGLYGDGIETFEMWDMDEHDDVRGWLTKEDINEYLSTLDLSFGVKKIKKHEI